jgi:hypothetical protein
MRFSVKAVAVVVTLAMSGVIFASSPASAAVAQACSLSVAAPYKLGTANTIQTVGNRTAGCGAGTTHLYIQKQRFPGWWDNVAHRTLSGGGFGSLNFSCAGYGTQTYRGQQSGTTVGGGTDVVNSASVRISCSG